MTVEGKFVSIMTKKMSLVFYQEIKYKWGREEYIDFCYRSERSWIVRIKAGVWKIRGLRRGFEKGTCHLCMGNEQVKHVLLSSTERK
jgi:hypothetical protein